MSYEMVSNKFRKGVLAGDFAGIALNLEKVGQTPCPSMPFVAIDDRKQFQRIISLN